MIYRQEIIRTLVCRDPKENLTMSAFGLRQNAKKAADRVDRHSAQGQGLDRDGILEDLAAVRYWLEIFVASIGSTVEELECKSVDNLHCKYSTTKIVNPYEGGNNE